MTSETFNLLTNCEQHAPSWRSGQTLFALGYETMTLCSHLQQHLTTCRLPPLARPLSRAMPPPFAPLCLVVTRCRVLYAGDR